MALAQGEWLSNGSSDRMLKHAIFLHVQPVEIDQDIFEMIDSIAESDANVLAIFSGPHSYISSSWYEKENVPTWNYIAVHVYGKIKIIEGDAVVASLKKLTDKYEQNSENPVRIEELSSKTMRQTSGIVAFEIEIESIEAVKKMSQNRNEKDYQNIISELGKTKETAAIEVANVMKKCPF